MSEHPTLTLTLPLPPSRNETEGRHHMLVHRMSQDYKRRAWFKALGQHPPKYPDELPEVVEVHLTFVSKDGKDADNHVTPKWPVDAIKAKQRGKVEWRQGVAVEKGYIRDDSERHMRLVGIQHVRSDNIEPCVIVKITPREAA